MNTPTHLPLRSSPTPDRAAPTPPHPSVRRRLLGAGAVASATLVVVTGCATSLPTSPSAEASFEHVHGLGHDPVTGLTYAAAHTGVWVVPTNALPDTYPSHSAAEDDTDEGPIAGRMQDTMGFTITPEGVFYASGHPDPAEQNPAGPNLGLIRSTDAATTWELVSLSGQTDFHDLSTAPLDDGTTRIYGYDAGGAGISRSDDSGTTWSTAAALEIRDLTTDPELPNRVLASTAEGLQVSDDGAESFRLVDGAPLLYLVESTGDGAYVGIDVDGAVWTGSPEGDWSRHGNVTGAPEALAFVGGKDPWILAADERGVVASPDYGETWTVLRSS
ncbi:F510_1955 family glycosylhydrolase [Clavibacter phaseoli]|uniref:F510_1955 family glycosylhydrolase n=1 Tax=Clavibacter phaseoli TaxID=1734031 RepID=UPI001F26BFB8|nr:hypothetical protein [Clavibacter phaseoli]UKF32441.1 hypothetical protein FGD69_14975 [Clavibacter phaseoli]UKF38538.1 hypothetical protein FGI33_15375 [Clavibacter phaseoli]